MKKISLKEIVFPIDVDTVKKILQNNGAVKVGELHDMDGFYLLNEEGALIPSRQILTMVWQQYLDQKIADYIKTINADGVQIDPKKQLLILYYLPEDKEKIDELEKNKMLCKLNFPNGIYIS